MPVTSGSMTPPNPDALIVTQEAINRLQFNADFQRGYGNDWFSFSRKDADPILSRLAALADPRSDWRGMDSAPKDGTEFVGWGKPSGLSPEGAYVTRWRAYGKGSLAHAAWERGEGPEGAFWHYEPVSNWTNGWTPRLWAPLPSAPEPPADAESRS